MPQEFTFCYAGTMTLTASFKSALRVRRWDRQFSSPKYQPRFRPRCRRYPKSKY